MRTELSGVLEAVEKGELPIRSEELFGEMWDGDNETFRTQETSITDYKDRAPDKFSDNYGASIARLAVAFHNTFGGIIIFGVSDKDRASSQLNCKLDVEGFSDFFTDATGANIEFQFRVYQLSEATKVGVLLVPKRGCSRPIAFRKSIGTYRVGMIWIRDRHSVREVDESFIPLLFTERRTPYTASAMDSVSVHRSLPPSPSTMQQFIGRKDLLLTLWDWLVFEQRPRCYLHGPGGSGKSTLAYEFSKQVADKGSDICVPGNGVLDYVLFISAKETELNVFRGAEQEFYLRRFSDSLSQYHAILVDSGLMTASDVQHMDELTALAAISELFSTYNGLIVIDDIDALSRRGEDTGEESLLLASMRAHKNTKILYTLRHPPSSALGSALRVPELQADEEFPKFVEAFSGQLGCLPPTKNELDQIDKASSRLPLLIETIIGLNVVCGSYQTALEQFNERGGDAARRYLYQREYDRLEKVGRAREVLASLYLLDEEVSFSVLSRILGFGDESVRDAIGECGAIFLLVRNPGQSEALYQLAPPAKSFIAAVSPELKTFAPLSRRVDLFLREDAAYTPEESAFIVELEQLIRLRKFRDVVDAYESRPRSDSVLHNQKVQALVGQGYAHIGPSGRTKARECFEAAYRLKFIDVFMARSWFYVENESDYGSKNAIEVCEKFLSQPKLSARYRSEFKCKLANCYLEQARRLSSISSEKTIGHYRKSIELYLSGLWIARYTDQIDEEVTLRWLRVPCVEFVRYLQLDLAPYFEMLAELPKQRHDVHLDGAHELMAALRASNADRDNQARKRIAGLTRKTIKVLSNSMDEVRWWGLGAPGG